MRTWDRLWLLIAWALPATGCDAVLGLGDIEVPGPGGAGGTGAGGGTAAGGDGGTTAVCGDGAVKAGEQCDDGDSLQGDGCDANCIIEPGWACSGEPSQCVETCGDGQADSWEECDDGNLGTDDGCSAACTVEHTCGDGVVDPTEQCDGGPGCTNCVLDPGTACANALQIAPDPQGLDPATGALTSYFEGDSALEGATLSNTDVPAAPCGSFENVVLHSYTTGARPAILTVETVDQLADGTPTFPKPVVWAYRDCPNKKDLDGCDAANNDGAAMTTGFLPARTTVLIVLASANLGDAGPYRLKVTEQPVRLIFHESFGPEKAPGQYPLPASLTQTLIGDAGWTTCVPGGGSMCQQSAPDSHSGGAHGLATCGTAAATIATLHTPTLDLSGLQVATGQFDYVFSKSGDLGFARVLPYDGDTPGAYVTYDIAAAGRAALAMAKSAQARLDFLYDDDAAAESSFRIDDIYIYGY